MGETYLHHVSNNQVRLGGHTEGVAVDDLSGHPAAVDEGLDGSPAFNTDQRAGLWRVIRDQHLSPDSQLGPGVVMEVGGNGDRSRMRNSRDKKEI